MSHSRKITLALGGGGARGFSHVGVLGLLAERGVAIDQVVGVSAGAVAGAGFCCGYSQEYIAERVMEFAEGELAHDADLRALVNRTSVCDTKGFADRLGRLLGQGLLVKTLVREQSLLGGEFFERMVDFFLPDIKIEDMPIPFAAVATDLIDGSVVVMDKGPLRRAVLASCSIPGVAPPVEVNGSFLIDGGVVSIVPVDVAVSRARGPVIAVNVDRGVSCQPKPDRALEVFLRADDLQNFRIGQLLLEKADLVVRPEVGDYHWADFHHGPAMIRLGREAALAQWPDIYELAFPPLWKRVRDGLAGRRSRAA